MFILNIVASSFKSVKVWIKGEKLIDELLKANPFFIGTRKKVTEGGTIRIPRRRVFRNPELRESDTRKQEEAIKSRAS